MRHTEDRIHDFPAGVFFVEPVFRRGREKRIDHLLPGVGQVRGILGRTVPEPAPTALVPTRTAPPISTSRARYAPCTKEDFKQGTDLSQEPLKIRSPWSRRLFFGRLPAAAHPAMLLAATGGEGYDVDGGVSGESGVSVRELHSTWTTCPRTPPDRPATVCGWNPGHRPRQDRDKSLLLREHPLFLSCSGPPAAR